MKLSVWTKKQGIKYHAADADINASKNIALRLSSIGDGQRLQQNNRTGFFCRAVGDECIVRHTKKTKRNRS